MSLQETLERVYQQRKEAQKRKPKLNIRGAVIMTQKELAALNRRNSEMFIVS
ncbi:hypothetical protein [Paenibacillus sp. Mc5Re-14]|uniref:hypothetical protein n=1 Tax=Paenibacillus sp. Mc5Re-14 TaxID=1030529 RepID=UPI000B248BFC|nr:hypothetical protein [Paenibacillus sp. Mc5Re-14]